MNDIMLDIETLDTRPSSVILSIGAVRFDINQPGIITDKFHEHISIESNLIRERTVSGSTVMWWLDQSDEARAKVTKAKREDLYAVLARLGQFIKEDDRVWGNGVGFDNAIVADAYRSCGLELPWRFWNDMCFRTLKALHKKDVPAPSFVGTAHDALDDAINQALHLQLIYKKMRGE